MKIYDISLALSPDLAIWSGDSPFCFCQTWKMTAGASANVGSVAMGVHCGTHVDAPLHYQSDGVSVDQCFLAPFLGPAFVVDLNEDGLNKGSITKELLEPFADELGNAPRLLLKTGLWSDHSVFPTSIPVLELRAIDWLQSVGVKLFGLDLPSVDDMESKELPNHHALEKAGIAILESIDLSGVASGRYNLAALPLKIVGGDAGPARAILWRTE